MDLHPRMLICNFLAIGSDYPCFSHKIFHRDNFSGFSNTLVSVFAHLRVMSVDWCKSYVTIPSSY